MSHVRRFDHVGITVADLDTVTAFFVGLGLEVEGTRMFVEGEFLDTVIGIPESRIARMGVANVSDLAEVSNYVYTVEDRGGVRSGLVRRHRRGDGFWPLVARAARAAADTEARPLSNRRRRVADEIGRRAQTSAPIVAPAPHRRRRIRKFN